MLLMVSARAATSPLAFTVNFCVSSPLATAVTTLTIPRTCSVRFAAMTFTLSVRSFQVPATPGTCACPPSFPSVPTSRATRVTSAANAFSWSTMVLMVFFNSRISPFTSTVILRDKSPRATAVVTPAMFLTCAVRFPAMAFTESVKSFHVPATPGTFAWPPRRPSVPTSRATHVHRNFLGKISCRDGRRHFGDISHLARQVAGHEVHVIGQILPRSSDARNCRLSAKFSVGADFASHARHLARERVQLVHHGVDGVLQL